MMDERTMLTIIEALAKALADEKAMREYFERRTEALVKELGEKDGQENG